MAVLETEEPNSRTLALRSEGARRYKQRCIRENKNKEREEDALAGVFHVDPSTNA